MPLVIDRYLAKEVLQTLLAVLVVLLLIFMGRYFALFLADASAGKVSSDILVDLLLLQTLSALSVIIPFGLYVAVLVAFGRLYKDSEMTALAACGVGLVQVQRMVLVIALACSAVVAVLAFWGTPWAHEKSLQLREQTQAASPFAAVAAGQFAEIGSAQRVFYVEKLSDDRTELHNVFVQDRKDGGMDIFSARGGYQYRDPRSGERYLVLVDGYRYEGLPGQVDFTLHQFHKYAVRLEEQAVVPLRRKRWSIPSGELWRSSKRADIAELQWRFSLPLATLLLSVLAVFLSRTSPRQGRFAKLFVAILIFVTYYNILGVAQTWVEQGKVPPLIGLWWVHAAMLLLVVAIALRQSGGHWLWRCLTSRTTPLAR
jgi:lipopolysaccharide export system permease protein